MQFLFSDRDLGGVYNLHNDAVVISMIIAKYNVQRILVDSGSLTDILFYDALVQMNLSDNQLKRVSTPLVGFSRESVKVKGEITFPITIRTPPD